MSLKVLSKRVAIQPIVEAEKTTGGLVIPDTAKVKQTEGIVSSVGEAVSQVKVGDRVRYPEYAGSRVVVNGNEFLIMHEEEILCTISE